MPRPMMRVAAVVLLLVFTGACADLAMLPERPTPFPTLARLPTVTPVPPTPSLLAQPLIISSPTTTPELPMARVAVVANVRAGPGVEYPVVRVFEAGAPVRLLGRFAGWYQVQGPGDVQGWMAAQVLEVDPSVAALVPEVRP